MTNEPNKFSVPWRHTSYSISLPPGCSSHVPVTCDKLRWECGWEHEGMIEVVDADGKNHPEPLFTVNFAMFDGRVADTLKDLVREWVEEHNKGLEAAP